MEIQLPRVIVEQLQVEDLDWFVDVAAVGMLVEELKRPELVNRESLLGLSVMGMTSGTAFIAKVGDVPIGALGSVLLPNIFNPKIMTLAEVFWYVLPEYRSTRAGAMLFNAFSEKADEVADEATLSLLPASKINVKTLEKRGFPLGEYAFRKECRKP